MEAMRLQVDLGERSYPIVIGEGVLDRIGEYLQEAGIDTAKQLFVITDENIAPLYLERIERVLGAAGYRTAAEIVPAGEKAKSMTVYEKVITAAIEAGLDRTSVILALGGGVVGDLAGFVAATYMRGIPFVQIPTTLLAHDSSVGGKVAINHPLGKNLIGAFHQPLAVLYDTGTLRTLPKREVAAGFAEVIKHALISDESFVSWLEKQADALLRLEAEPTAEAILRGCAVKAKVVSADETEQGLRAILNLGHTFGHAFEALCAYTQLNHGEAIAIGMGLAAETAVRLGLCDTAVPLRTKQLLTRFGLPTAWPAGLAPEDVLEAMRRDKKGRSGKLVLVLPREIGRVEIVKQVDERLVLEVMRASQGGDE
ncbi:3-dehydroquinate synthase [Brevibacillus sp. SYP-B805]|uniref:3-dehydroquinate synthase n=1 Tax=Brevibacillus sp. SYP-B805 TaxID=1578199 RepID=UPI0013EC7682|nr:3-dehydroquinate synthase [Brevibacillus sp. SYP-B805]NGQ94567.1 3-dehydroquinate synthase [Brevibacillus sp. SYP-B805]